MRVHTYIFYKYKYTILVLDNIFNLFIKHFIDNIHNTISKMGRFDIRLLIGGRRYGQALSRQQCHPTRYFLGIT